MGLLANRVGLDWNRFNFSGFVLRRSGGGDTVGCRGRGLLSGTPQMEMGPGAWQAAP